MLDENPRDLDLMIEWSNETLGLMTRSATTLRFQVGGPSRASRHRSALR